MIFGAALVAGLFVGCGGGASEQASTGTQDTAATVETANDTTAPLETRESEIDAREQELAEREAEIEQREQAARRPAPAPSKPRTTATSPATAPVDGATPLPRHYPRPEAEPAMQTVWITVPAATALNVEFVDPLSSETSVAGDAVRARVVDDVVSEGWIVVPRGSTMVGTVAEVVPSKKIGGQAKLAVNFERIELASGNSVTIQAPFVQVAKSQKGKDAATIGGAAAGGALLGRILKDGKDQGKATAIGAVVGAAVGTAVAANNNSMPVNFDSGMVASVSLTESVRVAVTSKSRDEAVAQR